MKKTEIEKKRIYDPNDVFKKRTTTVEVTLNNKEEKSLV